MDFHWWKSVECFHNCLVGYLKGFLNGLALYQFSCHTAGCNCCTAAECLEFGFLNNTVVINIQIHAHDISALCVADGTDTARVLDLSYVSRVIKMVHYLFAVHTTPPCFCARNPRKEETCCADVR